MTLDTWTFDTFRIAETCRAPHTSRLHTTSQSKGQDGETPRTWSILSSLRYRQDIVRSKHMLTFVDDYTDPPCAIRGQQKSRHPPVHPRPPREADTAWLDTGTFAVSSRTGRELTLTRQRKQAASYAPCFDPTTRCSSTRRRTAARARPQKASCAP